MIMLAFRVLRRNKDFLKKRSCCVQELTTSSIYLTLRRTYILKVTW